MVPPARTAAGRSGAAAPAAAAVAATGGATAAQHYAPQRPLPPSAASRASRATARLPVSPGRALAVAGGVVGLVVVVVLITGLVGGGDGGATRAPNTVGQGSLSAGSAPTRAVPAVDRSQVTVTVINGTTVSGLARAALNRLDGVGFQDGGVATDTTNQSRRKTLVFYADGDRAAAFDVARALKLPRSRATPFTGQADGPGIRLLARPDADVVVVLGADRAAPSPTG